MSLLALLPLALILLLMIGARWSAAAAGLAGSAAALPVAVVAFDYRGSAEAGLLPSLIGLGAEAVFLAFTILWIVFPALCLHELQLRSGATDLLRRGLSRLSTDSRLTALLIAWFFALFFEGAAGFGTPIALAAPLLVGLGFSPVRALTLTLIGHAVGVSFGAVGTPIMVQVAAGTPDTLALSAMTALLHALLGWTMAAWVYRLASEERMPSGSARAWHWPLAAALLFAVPSWTIAARIGPELPTLGGALLGGIAFAALLRWRAQPGSEPPLPSRDWGRAMLPYAFLLSLILITRLIAPLQSWLADMRWGWTLYESFRGSIQPLYHPGTLLMVCFLIGGIARKSAIGHMRASAAAALTSLPKVFFALIAMLVLARIMLHAGMIDAIAVAAGQSLGGAWPLLAPSVGVIGTFVTGSATASNILLTDLQRATAETLDLPLVLMIAAQGFGAAVGNIICPHNIVAGAATVGVVGREGEVMRRTLPACALYAALGGVLVFVIAQLAT